MGATLNCYKDYWQTSVPLRVVFIEFAPILNCLFSSQWLYRTYQVVSWAIKKLSYSLRQQTKQDLQRWKQTETLYRNGINWQPAYYILGKKSCPQILCPIWFGRAVM